MNWLDKYRISGTQQHTHLLLNGGKLHVPDASHGVFLVEYANAIKKAATPDDLPCVVECRTDVFKLFVDLDAKAPEELQVIDDVLMEILKAARDDDVFGGSAHEVIVLEPAVPTEGKRGIHLVFPNVLVNAETAKAFRRMVVAQFPEAPAVGKVFDACVYVGSGLRMPFSGKGKPGGSVYVASKRLIGDQEKTYPDVLSLVDIRQIVKDCSIRAPGASPGVFSFSLNNQGSSGSGNQHSRRVYLAPDLHEKIAELIQCLPECFAGSGVAGVHVAESGTVVIKSTARACGNLGWRSHNSNTVYFTVTPTGVRQRCFCRCETLEHRTAGVMCKDYVSDPFLVPLTTLEAVLKACGELQPNMEFEPLHPPSKKTTSLDALLSMSRVSRTPAKRKRK